MKPDASTFREGDPPCWDAVAAVLNQHLEEQGMRRTPERYEILRAIYRSEGHFTAEQLFSRMTEHYHVTHATIYAALDLFESLGLVVRHCFTKALCWERTYGVRNHFHQVCTRCGRVREVKMPRLAAALDTARWSRFRAHTLTVCAFGLCASCQSQITRRQRSVASKKSTTVRQSDTGKHSQAGSGGKDASGSGGKDASGSGGKDA